MRIGSDVYYAPFVNDGTPPHTIRASRKPWLKFRVNGQWVQVREVHHPGTKAQPFLDDALRQVAARRGYSFREG